MQTIFLIILAVVSAVHLVSLFFSREKLQAVTKILLIPLILAVYISRSPAVFVPVVLALLFGWAGDIFLLKIDDIRFFRLGLASFLLGHICYIIAIFHFTLPFNMPVFAISAVVAAILGFCAYRLVRPTKEMIIPAAIYEIVLLSASVCALQLFLAKGAPSGAFIFAGSLCFLVSDTLLAYFTFGARPKYGQFLVMLTYISAQLCLALGFASLGI